MNCINCDITNNKEIYRGLMHCPECGLVYYNKEIGDKKLRELYQEEYFNGSEYLDYQDDKKTIQKNFSARIKDIKKYVSSGSIFEIGSAYGFFLDVAKDDFSVEGIDITEKPTEFARKELKLRVATGSYLEHQVKTKKDIFCMWDTIEHLSNPEKFIKKISSEIKPGGYLFLTTGDIGSFVAKRQKNKWRMIHPPTHLYYFSKKSITKLLEKNGFEVVKINHPGVFRSLKQIVYALFFLNSEHTGIGLRIRKKVVRLFEIIDFPIYLNTFDIMMVVAKEKGQKSK